MKKIVAGICLSFCLAGCFDKYMAVEYPVIDVVNSAGKYQRVYCSDFFSSIELIPLETRDECLLDGVPSPTILLNDSVILMKGNGRLYAFGRSGKFLNQIGERGQGPGEFLTLSDIFFNTDKPTIFVSDFRNIFEYEFNGKFIRSFTKPTVDGNTLADCSYAGDSLFIGHVFYDGKNKYNFCLFNQLGDTVKCFFNHIFFNRVAPSASRDNRAMRPIRVDSLLYLKDYVNDTLYVLTHSNLQPAYVFGLGKYSYPLEYMENNNSPFPNHSFLFQNFGIVGIPNYFFYEIRVPDIFPRPKSKLRFNHLINQFRSTESTVYGIYDIERNTNTFLDTDQHFQKGIINDMNGGLSFIPRYYAGDDIVVDVWQAYEMKEILTEEYFAAHEIKHPQAHQKLKELLKNLDEEDNPVIVIAKLK